MAAYRDKTFTVNPLTDIATINYFKFHCVTPLFGFYSYNITISSLALLAGMSNITIGFVSDINSQMTHLGNWHIISDTLKYRFVISNRCIILKFYSTVAQVVTDTLNTYDYYEITNTSLIDNYALMWQ